MSGDPATRGLTRQFAARGRTAIRRTGLSLPVQTALRDGHLGSGSTLFDFGCGRGGDLDAIEGLVSSASGWDPNHRPDAPKVPADVVNLGFVLNVIESPLERREVLEEAWSLATRLLIVSARLLSDARGLSGTPEADGIRTAKRTFQKFFGHRELQELIESALGVPALGAGPGIFYVFRDARDRQRAIADRFRVRVVLPPVEQRADLFRAHRELLTRLMEFFGAHGRLPRVEDNWEPFGQLLDECGSAIRAWQIIQGTSDAERWKKIRLLRRGDLALQLALERFAGPRVRFSDLPATTQADIRAHFGSYREAIQVADSLLFSAGKVEVVSEMIRSSSFGKKLPTAMYIHRATLDRLHPVLRAYEGCARILLGQDERFNVVKLRSDRPSISYLEYGDFDRVAHPVLGRSIRVDLQELDLTPRDYSDSGNPPILHRKELLVDQSYPNRDRFCRLTEAEERAGLFDEVESIGTRDGWTRALEERGLAVRGHSLRRVGTA